MSVKSQKNKGGRPLKIINKEIFEEYCSYCQVKEWIADALGVDVDTLHRWVLREYKMSFSGYLRQKSAVDKIEILKEQKELGKTNASMAIWLGKQRLSQSENPNDKNDMGLLPTLMGVLERVANRNAK